jgi:hypothetical protein
MNKSKRSVQTTTLKTFNMKEAKTFEAYPLHSPLTPLTDAEFEAENLPEEWRGFAYWEAPKNDGALWPAKRLQILDPQ